MIIDRNVYAQIRGILDAVNKAVEYIQNLHKEDYDRSVAGLVPDLNDSIEIVNQSMFESGKVSFYDPGSPEKDISYDCREELTGRYRLWADTTSDILERWYGAANDLEQKFMKLMDYVRYVDFDTIVEHAKECLLRQGDEMVAKFCGYYQRLSYLGWGGLDVSNDQYDVIINRVTALKEHREDFIWLYGRLGDWRSRLVLYGMLHCWITFDLDDLRIMQEGNYTDYFDLDLVKCDEQEVVVDLGAWIGDSVMNYIVTYGRYKRIYCYEIDKLSMETMKKNLSEYTDIEYRNKGVGNRNGKGYIDTVSPGTIYNSITDRNTGEEIEIVCLDDDIEEKVTLIKMDIEGGEQNALSGCARHIREEKPKLLICVYHNNEDIWKIPRMIMEMNPEYQFYLRSNALQWGPSEIVLFAV